MKLAKFILPVLLLFVVVAAGGVSVCVYPKSPFKDSLYCSKLNKILFKSASDKSAFGDLLNENKETTKSGTDVPITPPSYTDTVAFMRATYGFDLDETPGNFTSYDGNLLRFSIESTAVELKPASDFLVICTPETVSFGDVEINATEMMVDYSATPDSELIELISGYMAVDRSVREMVLKNYAPGKPIKVVMKDSEFLRVGIYSQNCQELYQQ